MSKIKTTTLIKFCMKMAEQTEQPQEEWAVQKRRYKAIGEALEEFDAMSKRDDETTAKNVVKVGAGTYEGNCIKCKMQITSRFDFCPRCGRPIDWEESKKTARKI